MTTTPESTASSTTSSTRAAMRPIRGMKDMLPSSYSLYEKIVKSSSKIASRYCFENFATPIMEYTEVFDRSLGETTDVISKEMYSFEDRSGDNIALRPEFTAGIMRSIFSEGLTHQMPLRLFSYGPVFRHDRPQAGRHRQFHQVNFEILGETSANTDAEAIKIGHDIIQDLGIKDIEIEVNSLGCVDSRAAYHLALKEYLIKYESELSEDSQKRLHKNPMRILDSKSESDQKILEGAPSIADHYKNNSQQRFEQVLSMLDEMKVPYSINSKLVRGLDYYCHTAFEYTTKKIGAQTAIGGGGRYDGLARLMGKADIPAIGLALGVERIMLLTEESHEYKRENVGIFPISENEITYSYMLADKLRAENVPTLVYESGKLGKRIDKAAASGCKYAAFIGEKEVQTGLYKIKNLINGTEEILSFAELAIISRPTI